MSKHESKRGGVPAIGLAAILAALLATGCLDTPRAYPGAAAGQEVAVAVEPSTAVVPTGGTQLFAAAVTGTADTAVTWKVLEAGCGVVNTTGGFTAPAAPANCHVVATSHADPTKSASAVVTVQAPPPPAVVAVVVTPGSTSAFGCQTATFTAAVTGTTNTAVTWSVTEAGGGTVTASGVYTAPATDGTFHVVATSVADPTVRATAAIVVTTRVLSVAVSPSAVDLPPGGSAQFTATVTTTCGTTTSLAMVQAPSVVTGN